LAGDQVTGRVLSLIDGDDGLRADVVLDSLPACARCRAGRGCGAGVFTPENAKRRVRVGIPAGSPVAIGDTVCLAVTGTSVSAAAFTAYGLPLVGALAGGITGLLLSAGDAVAAAIVAAGLLAGAGLARRRARRRNEGHGSACYLEVSGVLPG
jgi:positive regulator of sigma E activity